MRTVRAALALLLSFAVPIRAETTADPLWYLLSTYVLAPDAKAVEAQGEGPTDAEGLAALQADLLVLSDGFEAFRDESQVKEALERLQPRISPDLKPFFRDRASSLGAIYRTLAVTDYTWAQRFPEPPCTPVDSRRRLLHSRDGLFQTENGEASPWLVSLLGTEAMGKSAEQALDQASSQAKLTGSGYEKLRARARKLTMALASDKAIGVARSRLYCSRAAAFESLAAHHRAKDAELIEAGRTVALKPEESVFVVVWKDRRAAATLLRTKSGAILVTDAAIVADTDHPFLFAYSKSAKPVELAATVVRRHPQLSVAALAYAEDQPRPALALAENAPAKDDLVTAVGHTVVSGLWTKTSGLVTKVGEVSFQTDAAVSPELSGAPVLNEAGEVAGMLVLRPADTEEGRWPVAIPAPVLARWLDDPAFALSGAPATEQIEDWGTAAVLSRARPSALTEAGLGDWHIPNLPPPPSVPNGVCVQNCDSGSSPRSSYSRGSSSSAGTDEFGEALGQLALAMVFKGIPMLFRGLGKLSKGESAPKAPSQPLVKVVPAPKPAPPPKPQPKPKQPPKLEGLELTLTPDELLEGESIEAVATLRFSGDEPKKGGIIVSVAYGGKTYTARTGPSGVATFTIPIDSKDRDLRDRPFEALKDEENRTEGEEVPSYLTPDRKKPTANDKVKQRSTDAFSSLDDQERAAPDPESVEPEEAAGDAVAEDWADDEEGPVQAGASLAPMTVPAPNAVPLEKLYDLSIEAKASAGNMGSANDSKSASVMSNRCPPGTVPGDQDPLDGSPGQPPSAPHDKPTLDKVCKEYEEAADETCASSTKACKDTVLILLEYDFRSCLKRWEPDGGGSTGSIGEPSPPKPKRVPPSRRCVPAERTRTGSIAGPTHHARGLGKGEKRPMSDAVRASWRSLIKKLLAGARFLKNVTHAIFEVQGGLAKLTELFDAVTQGQSVDSKPGGIKTARMPDGTTIALRPSSSGGPPTIQINGPGGQKVKIRAP